MFAPLQNWQVRAIGVGIILCAIVASAVLPLFASGGMIPIYMKATDRYLAGEQFYLPNEPPAYTYPPAMILTTVPLAVFPEYGWRALNWLENFSLAAGLIALATVMVWPVIAADGPPLRDRRYLIAATVVTILCLKYIISPIKYQAHDLMVVVAVGGAALAMSRSNDKWGGLLGGMAAALKATPMLLLPVLVMQRRVVASMTFGTAVLVLTLLPDLFVASPDDATWAQSWYSRFVSKTSVGEAAEGDGAWTAWNALNQSIPGTMYRLMTPVETGGELKNVAIADLGGRTAKLIVLLIEVAVFGFIVLTCRRSPLLDAGPLRSFYWMGAAGVVLCGMLLLSPMSSTQHFCALCLPIAFFTVHYFFIRRTWVALAGMSAVMLGGPLASQDLVGETYSSWAQAAGSATIVTIACMVSTGVLLLSDRKRSEQIFARFESDSSSPNRDEAIISPPAAAA
ncbi:glycosyltransferase family 87 protein [Stratiformator vulcanicus]|uniref:DUF2029 domain-containing protein n=1 Tax=Stratiformator vulcanicus TaxID=2527980 RepID=A0A517R031_9PLAN|nr:glycosyltransferase family 87 protein [Stratiformator vulcanicus]QDT37255.1 hypothetical protein Pan189_16280 [Stratiformator vulcanicus]